VNTKNMWTAWVLPPAAVLVVLLLWQGVTSARIVSPVQFPTMTASMAALWHEIVSGRVWSAVGATLLGWAIGMVITVVLGIVVGTALAVNRFALRSAAPVIEIFKAIPAIAILPLVILVAGSTLPMKVFLICFAAFWPFVIQVIYGVQSMDQVVMDTSRALGVRGVRRFFSVSIPSASPYLVTGMRIASAQALILAVVAEIVGGAEGIGRNILLAENSGTSAYPTMYAYILVSGVLGIALTGAFFLMERRLMHWHESQRNIRAANRTVGA
jgi:ABC-type nitrate/sulfonate/bicarbonate transport system permease component